VDQDRQPGWRPTRRQVLWTVGVIVALVVAIIVLGYVREWEWTGLVKDKNFSYRTLWDWLKLLIVPAVLAMGGYLFTWTANRNSQMLAENQMRDAALQTYLDQMGELLIHEKLREASLELHEYQNVGVGIAEMPHVDVNTLAIARTLTVLPRLDADRKRSLLQFLYEAGLIYSGKIGRKPIISLSGGGLLETASRKPGAADLQDANLQSLFLVGSFLHDANLSGANLKKANLQNANLTSTDLRNADLSGATLSGAAFCLPGGRFDDPHTAYLYQANLTGVDLRDVTIIDQQLATCKSLKGAAMPNGQKYEAWLKTPEGQTWLRTYKQDHSEGEETSSP
jgi:hypothetical protein